MTPEDLANQIYELVVQHNCALYEELFESTTSDAAIDPYWKSAVALYKSLNEGEKSTLHKVIRQVTVDAVSTILSMLDGISSLPGSNDLELRSRSDSRQLNGELQNLFLEIDEFRREQ